MHLLTANHDREPFLKFSDAKICRLSLRVWRCSKTIPMHIIVAIALLSAWDASPSKLCHTQTHWQSLWYFAQYRRSGTACEHRTQSPPPATVTRVHFFFCSRQVGSVRVGKTPCPTSLRSRRHVTQTARSLKKGPSSDAKADAHESVTSAWVSIS